MSIVTDPNDPHVSVPRPYCVVLDANIWRSHLFLKTPVGVSLVYTLGREHAFLGLPEVVEMELAEQVMEVGLEAAEQTKKWSRILATLTGSPFYPVALTEIDLGQIVPTQLSELTRILKRVPFTLAHAKAALGMVNAKVPPNNENNQQFKDSAIWQAVLDLSREHAVHFVTNDRAFLADRGNPSKGLATNLKEDCIAANGSVAVYCDLGSCLAAISSNAPHFDHDHLKSLIESFVTARLRGVAKQQHYEVKELLGAEITAFRTADPSRVAMDFKLITRYEPDSSSQQDRGGEGRAETYGSCYYDPKSDSVVDGFVQEIRFLHRSPTWSGAHAREFSYEDPAIPFPRRVPWE